MRSSSDRPASQRLPHRMGLLAACLLPLALTGCEKWRLDAEVARLCAKDGGIKVYETVKLPADQFDQWGVANIPPRERSKSVDAYYYEHNSTVLQEGNPRLIRDHFMVRRADGEVLISESIGYSRLGGDLPGPWPDSAHQCPGEFDISALKRRTFLARH